MSSLDFSTTRAYLSDFRFSAMFIEVLGWSRPAGIRSLSLTIEGEAFTLAPIAQLAGIVVFEVSSPGLE